MARTSHFPEEKLENFKIINKKKSQKDYIFIIGCLKDHFLFCNLSMSEL